MTSSKIGRLYVVTDPGAPVSPLEQALAAARGGAWAVQLRDKTAPEAEFRELAREILLKIRPFGTKLFINDRLEAALAVGAEGLHIGQEDGDPRLARDRIGPEILLGLSIENEAQIRRLPAGLVDYVGVGPIRPTATKPDHAPPLGLGGLARITALAPCPAIAIGGLGAGDAAALALAGAAGIAVVSAVSRAPDPEAAARALLQEWSPFA